MITDVASTSSLRNPPAISQYCVALRLSVSEAGNMDDSAGGEHLETKEPIFSSSRESIGNVWAAVARDLSGSSMT